MVTVSDVKLFWQDNPLWQGESSHLSGTKEFFEEHRKTVIEDCLAGELDPRTLPDSEHRGKVLDLGCGPGFWTIELNRLGCSEVLSADLTEAALALTKRRCSVYGYECRPSQQNAEAMSFPNEFFSHVNCQGVIHHTPDTEACIREIHRVLEKNGTAALSVYYRNIFLEGWPLFRWVAKVIGKLAPRLEGRGRESIATLKDANEIVRLFDGAENPLGKAYSREEFLQMLYPYFEVKDVFLHFFPARSLPIQIPKRLHSWLDQKVGFMIYVSLKKKA